MYHDAQTFGLKSSYPKAVSNSNLAITWLEATFPELCLQATGGNLSAVKAQPYALFDASISLQVLIFSCLFFVLSLSDWI